MGSGTSIGDVTSKLTLDSAEFDAKLAKSGEGLDRHATLTEKASARARAAWEKELVAQANAQAKLEQANRAKELAALKSDILARSVENEAKAVTTAGHASVSQMQATSAAVRSLEGNPGIRAVERFLTTIPGVGNALKAAFPVVGAVAFGAVIAEQIEKIAEFAKKVHEMPRTIQADFDALNLGQRTTIDGLDLANDKLQNAIDKMAKRPENNVKVAFDEAKLAADRLAEAIERDNEKLNALLSKNHLSGFALLFGSIGTADREGTAKAFGRQADTNAYDLADATSRGDAAGVAKAHRALVDTQNAQLAEARADLARRLAVSKEPGNPNDETNINIDRGVITAILNQQRQDAAQQLNAQKEAEKQIADDKKAAEEEKKQAAAAAREAQRKANEEAIRALEEAHRAWQAITDRSKGDEVAYWADRVANLKNGSAAYLAAVKQFQQETIALNRENAEAIANFTKEFFADFNKTGGSLTPEADKSNEKAQGGFAKDYIASLRASIDGNEANADAIARASIQMQLATGNMTKLAAAQALAALNTQQYNDALEKLQDRQNYVTRSIAPGAQPSLEQKAQLNDIQTQRAALDTKRTIQSQQDQLAIHGRDTSPLVGATDALNDFIAATRDSAAEMRGLVDKTLGGLNTELVKAISTRGSQRAGFADFGAGLGRDVAGIALKKGEGSILSMFGLGADGAKKPSGTATDPLHVMVANIQAFQGAPQLPNLLPSLDAPLSSVPFSNFLPGGGGGTMPSVGSLLGTALSFLPGFASGGAIDPDQWAIVGEEGPELFHSGGGGTIIPNDKIGGAGGDTHHHTWNIDARGATDPAQVHRQIMEAAPHIAAAAVKQVSEGKMRGPSSKR